MQNKVKTKPRWSKNTADKSMMSRLKATLLKAAPRGNRGRVSLDLFSSRLLAWKNTTLPKKMRMMPQIKGRIAGPGAFRLPKGKVAAHRLMTHPRIIQQMAVTTSRFFISVISQSLN
ncbi:MAG: hypothetical protein L7F78_24510 [Syntrophales bacterium LBB04]|nr:hypothetical protein [Syntrophales bacterium LBB04]